MEVQQVKPIMLNISMVLRNGYACASYLKVPGWFTQEHGTLM
jgi:hypothetical protein